MKFLLLSLLFILTVPAFSQSTKDNASVPDSLIRKKLVELATSGPSSKLIEHQNKILEYQLKAAKNTWLNLLTLSLNYNDLTLSGQNTTYVYPKYFFGLNIPLGTLLSRTQVKSAKEQIKVKENEKETLVRKLKVDILSMYLQLQNYNERILLQTNVIDDIENLFLKVKEDFKNDAVSIEAYTTAQKHYTDELIKGKQLELDRDILKLQIEAVIGVTVEEAIQQAGASMRK